MNIDADIVGAAGAGVAAGLVLKLVEKGILDREDALAIYDQLLKAKEAKAVLAGADAEFMIADAVLAMRAELVRRFPG